jgi:hypothetical protein
MLTVKVDSDSELSRKIRTADASGEALLVDTGDAVYALHIQKQERPAQQDIWANYDPERVLKAFDEATGILEGVDIEQLKSDLREQREQDSQGRPA